MSGAWWVAVLLLAVALLWTPSAEGRLRHATGRPGRGGGPARPAGRGWLTVAPGRREGGRAGPGGEPVDAPAVVSELATLLRAGLPPARAWAAVAATLTGAATGAGAAASEREALGVGEAFGVGEAARHCRPGGLDEVVVRVAAGSATGHDVATLLRREADRAADGSHAPMLHALAAAWHVAAASGAPTAGVLERLAESLRAEADQRDARSSALAAPRATARVLVALPVAGVLLGEVVGASPVAVLLGTGPGRVCAVAGGAATLASWWWTRLLVRRAEGARPRP